ncbi:MAG: hypothetical protein IT287_06230, partial [Bdellovibrionaceae bacterium]|nr:hypothetical protein [Pseudobdellovibrionaceae bacterium]
MKKIFLLTSLSFTFILFQNFDNKSSSPRSNALDKKQETLKQPLASSAIVDPEDQLNFDPPKIYVTLDAEN